MNESERRSFGIYLKELRIKAGLSLRDVEKAVDREISNAYISQLESGKIETPSPHILDKLATVYRVRHHELMEEAGYIKRSKAPRSGIAFSRRQGLTLEEREELIRYLEFIRMRKGKNKPQ